MRIFPVNDALDKEIGAFLSQINHLRNGDTAQLISESGASYLKNYGVMLVHLRQMGKCSAKNNELARRLWFREIRETMILATLVALPDELEDEELTEWGNKIGTVELAEQMAMNILGKRAGSDGLLFSWLNSSSRLLSYSAAMAIGWQYRFLGARGFGNLPDCMKRLKEWAAQPGFILPVGHLLKMAGRFSPAYRDLIMNTVGEWSSSENELTRQVAVETAFELEGSPDL
jgi:hypothetical protein